jgi:hypothetical protein
MHSTSSIRTSLLAACNQHCTTMHCLGARHDVSSGVLASIVQQRHAVHRPVAPCSTSTCSAHAQPLHSNFNCVVVVQVDAPVPHAAVSAQPAAPPTFHHMARRTLRALLLKLKASLLRFSVLSTSTSSFSPRSRTWRPWEGRGRAPCQLIGRTWQACGGGQRAAPHLGTSHGRKCGANQAQPSRHASCHNAC